METSHLYFCRQPDTKLIDIFFSSQPTQQPTKLLAGSPIKLSADEDPAASGFIKLATIFYGSIGIPLLVLTVAKSGHQLAYSSLNSLIVVRHYCFSLPAHYLCCSCNMFSCLKTVLSWCCCCCCCFSFLRCLLRNHSRPRSPTAAKKSRPDKRPRLRLLRHRPPEGATESTKSTPAADNELALQQSRSPYVIGFNVDPNQRTGKYDANHRRPTLPRQISHLN